MDNNMSYVEDFNRFIRSVNMYTGLFGLCRLVIFITCIPYIVYYALGTGGVSIIPVLVLTGMYVLTHVMNSLLAENIHLFFPLAMELADDEHTDSKDL